MIRFPRSQVLAFYKANPSWRATGRTLGDVFIEKMAPLIADPEDLAFVTAIQEADSLQAGRMIIDRTDWNA